MLTLPVEFTSLMITFAPLFSWRVWQHAQVLLVGAILAPGKRTVTAALRVMGLSQSQHFQNYHPRKLMPTWGWRPNANGRTWPSPVPPQPCWGWFP